MCPCLIRDSMFGLHEDGVVAGHALPDGLVGASGELVELPLVVVDGGGGAV